MTEPRAVPAATPTEPIESSIDAAALRWVLPATILGSSLGFVDGSVVNVAIPAMQASLQSTLGPMQWVINGYTLMLASLLLLGGALGDRYGRRRIFIYGLVAFAVASAGCAAAASTGWLVVMRVLQGAGAALLVPNSLAIIGAAFPAAARGRAIGTWAAAAAVMTAIGPPLGGWLIDTVGWRAIFLINPPVAAIAILMAVRIPADRPALRSRSIDIAGSILAVAALGLPCYGLIALGEGARSAGVLALCAALPAIACFVWVQARSQAPMLPLVLFRNAGFAGANLLTLLLYAALSAALFIVPYALIAQHGYSATAAGAALMPFSIIMGVGSRLAGSLSDRLGARLPLIGGPLLAACGFTLLGLSGGVPGYWLSILPGLVFVAAGMTIAIPPLTSTVFGAAPPDMSGVASGINNAAARGGGLIAVAAMGLAFGGSDHAGLSADNLADAYRAILLGASLLALVSAACAAVAIPRDVKASPASP